MAFDMHSPPPQFPHPLTSVLNVFFLLLLLFQVSRDIQSSDGNLIFFEKTALAVVTGASTIGSISPPPHPTHPKKKKSALPPNSQPRKSSIPGVSPFISSEELLHSERERERERERENGKERHNYLSLASSSFSLPGCPSDRAVLAILGPRGPLVCFSVRNGLSKALITFIASFCSRSFDIEPTCLTSSTKVLSFRS